jgi:hypothetical protein
MDRALERFDSRGLSAQGTRRRAIPLVARWKGLGTNPARACPSQRLIVFCQEEVLIPGLRVSPSAGLIA